MLYACKYRFIVFVNRSGNVKVIGFIRFRVIGTTSIFFQDI